MAFQTVTFELQNIVGNVREDYGTFTDSATTGEVRTRLKWLQAVRIMRHQGAGGQAANIWLNTDDTTEGKADFGGVFHYDTITAGAVRYCAYGR